MMTTAIIPAAGTGSRSGLSQPKQFMKFGGRELIVWTLERFQNCDEITDIVLATSKESIGFLGELADKYGITKITGIVEGGAQRQDSVYSALSSLPSSYEGLIAVHDAARPLIPPDVLSAGIRFAAEKGSALFALKAKDTLIQKGPSGIGYLNRDNVYQVQTPQIFRYKELKQSFELAYKTGFYGTDESMLMQNAGYSFEIFEGSVFSFKVTGPDDVELFRLLTSAD